MTNEELLALSNEQLKVDQYPFTVRPLSEEDGGGYLIEFPDIAGCISDGETPEEAVTNGRDALRSMLLTMMEFGDPIPEPGTSVSVALPHEVGDRLTTMAKKRQMRPADLISEALDKAEPAA
jgi:antitoxin HicB